MASGFAISNNLKQFQSKNQKQFEGRLKQEQISKLFFSIVPQLIKPLCKDKYIDNYFKQFFKTFTFDYVLSSVYIIENQRERDSYIKNYHSVTNKLEMQDYLNKTPGLYAKLALWAISYPYESTISLPSTHHIMLRALLKTKTYGFKPAQINISHNLVRVSWVVHHIFHFVRLLEFGQYYDDYALYGLRQKERGINQRGSLLISQDQRLTIANFHNNLISQLIDKYPEFEKERAQRYKDAGEKVGSQKMNDYVKKILLVDSKWRHKDDCQKPESEIFVFTHKAQSPDRCSLQRFAEMLIQAEIERNNSLGKSTPEQDVQNVAKQIGAYFGGRNERASVYGFYLVDPFPEPPIRSISLPGNERFLEIQQNRLKNKNDLDILKNISQYRLINGKLPRGNILKPFEKFNTFFEIAQLCLETEEKYLQGKLLSSSKQYPSKLARYLKDQMLIKAGLKSSQAVSKGYNGWIIEKKTL